MTNTDSDPKANESAPPPIPQTDAAPEVPPAEAEDASSAAAPAESGDAPQQVPVEEFSMADDETLAGDCEVVETPESPLPAGEPEPTDGEEAAAELAAAIPPPPASPASAIPPPPPGAPSTEPPPPTSPNAAVPPPPPGASSAAAPPPPIPPPPVMPAAPPPHYAPPPLPKKPSAMKRGCLGCGIAALVGVVLFFGFFFVIGTLFDGFHEFGEEFSGALKDKGGKIQEVGEDGTPLLFADGMDKIAIIDIKGVIMNQEGRQFASSSRIIKELNKARRDPLVVAVILDMNTPGGEVIASDEIRRAVDRCSEVKPVITCMRTLAASGGYYIASGSDWIVAHKLTMTGSVGVIISTVNYSALFEKVGLKAEVFRSGDMKDMLSSSRATTERERKYVQSLVDSTFHEFASQVAAGRERYKTAEEVMAQEFADGRILHGNAALDLGLVDQLGYFDDAVKYAREKTGAAKAILVRYKRPPRFSDLFFSMQSEKKVEIDLIPKEFHILQPGCHYYIMPGYAGANP